MGLGRSTHLDIRSKGSSSSPLSRNSVITFWMKASSHIDEVLRRSNQVDTCPVNLDAKCLVVRRPVFPSLRCRAWPE